MYIQIASVVVNRQLSRPRKGMPQSWKCAAPVLGAPRNGLATTQVEGWAWAAAPLEAIRKGVAEAAQSPLLKGAVGLGLLWLNRQPLGVAGGLLWSRLGGSLGGLGRAAAVMGAKARKGAMGGSRVDLAALGRATDSSAFDKVHMKASVLRRGKVF
jgi:hypothetical protein